MQAEIGIIRGTGVYDPQLLKNVDINGDSIINIKDASIIGVNWQKHA